MANKRHDTLAGAVAMIPLAVATAPWGVLAGVYALEAGMTALQAQLMSLAVFAGAAQLAATGMYQAGIGVASILLATAMITSRHLLYALAMRQRLQKYPSYWRLPLGFLLTDELFVVQSASAASNKRWFLFGAGFCMYVTWNLSTLAGIIVAETVPNIGEWGLDFAVVATFSVILAPKLSNNSAAAAALCSGTLAVFCELKGIQSGLLLAILAGMFAGYLHSNYTARSAHVTGASRANKGKTGAK